MSVYRNPVGGEWLEGCDVNRDVNPAADAAGEYTRADAVRARDFPTVVTTSCTLAI